MLKKIFKSSLKIILAVVMSFIMLAPIKPVHATSLLMQFEITTPNLAGNNNKSFRKLSERIETNNSYPYTLHIYVDSSWRLSADLTIDGSTRTNVINELLIDHGGDMTIPAPVTKTGTVYVNNNGEASINVPEISTQFFNGTVVFSANGGTGGPVIYSLIQYSMSFLYIICILLIGCFSYLRYEYNNQEFDGFFIVIIVTMLFAIVVVSWREYKYFSKLLKSKDGDLK